MLPRNKVCAACSRAVYSHVIAIIDHDGGLSISDDAENLVGDLAQQGFDLTKYRIIQPVKWNGAPWRAARP
ncbi:MAG TPA: hypothetical protein VJ770_22860 [Stellaceae bacterium]|nr:hypothetical protein [Stellaceae bacterium]